jgi:hypothetical protein
MHYVILVCSHTFNYCISKTVRLKKWILYVSLFFLSLSLSLSDKYLLTFKMWQTHASKRVYYSCLVLTNWHVSNSLTSNNTRIHSRGSELLHVHSRAESYSESFINPFVSKNILHNLKVYGGNETMISFLSVQLLLSFNHLTTAYM